MSVYNFIKSITKLDAFLSYISKNFPLYEFYSYSEPNLEITCSQVLTNTEFITLQTLISDYVDPEVFLTLNTTITDSVKSKETNSITPETILTFIWAVNNPNGTSVFSSLKWITEYSTEVSDWANVVLTGPAIATFQIYCKTREFIVDTITVDNI